MRHVPFFINSVWLVVNTVGLFFITNKNLLTVFQTNEKKILNFVHLSTCTAWKCGEKHTHTHRLLAVHSLFSVHIGPITKSLSIMALICVFLTCLSLNIHQQSFIIQLLIFSTFIFFRYFTLFQHFQTSPRNAFVIRSFSIFCCQPL